MSLQSEAEAHVLLLRCMGPLLSLPSGLGPFFSASSLRLAPLAPVSLAAMGMERARGHMLADGCRLKSLRPGR